MTNQYPWSSNTTPPIASQDDPRYETPGGAANKIEQSLQDSKEYTDESLLSYEAQTVNIADDAVTRPKIAPGAVGGTELDQSLLDYTTDIAVAAKFNEVDSQLAETVEELALKATKHELTIGLAPKADQSYVDTQFANIVSGAPKGTYTTLAALQAALPTGAEGTFLVLADGNWYYWNGTAWASGGVYQSTKIPEKSIGIKETKYLMVGGVPSTNLFAGWELGLIDFTNGSNITGTNKIRSDDFLIVDPSTTYTISDPESLSTLAANAQVLFEYDANKVFIKYVNINVHTVALYTTSSTCRYVKLLSQTNGSGGYVIGNYTTFKTQVEVGTTATPYTSGLPKINTDGLKDGIVTTRKLAEGIVTPSKINWRSTILLNPKLVATPTTVLSYSDTIKGSLSGFKHWGIKLKPVDKTFNTIKLDITLPVTNEEILLVVKVRNATQTVTLAQGVNKLKAVDVNGKLLIVLNADVNAISGLIIEVYGKTQSGVVQNLVIGQTNNYDSNINAVYYSTVGEEDVSLTAAAAGYNGFNYELFNLTGKEIVNEPFVSKSSLNNMLIVDKNGNGDFKTIQAAVNAANDSLSNPVTIIVYPGIYLESVYVGGGRFLSIIGINKKECIIKSTSGLYEDAPLEIAGNCYIENMTLISIFSVYPTELTGHKAYAVHVDYAGEGVVEFNNCHLKSSCSAAIGSGTQNNQTIKFRNCLIESDTPSELTTSQYGAVFFHASTVTTAVNQQVEMHNCIIRSTNANTMWLADVNGASDIYLSFYNNMFWSSINSKSDSSIAVYGSKVHITEDSYGNNVAKLNK